MKCLGAVFTFLSIASIVDGSGLLVTPPPRSYTQLTERSDLINAPPCGDLSGKYSLEISSTDISNLQSSSQIISEGLPLSIEWKPIFYTNQSSYQFYLCVETHDLGFSKCLSLASDDDDASTIFTLNPPTNQYYYYNFNNDLISQSLSIPNNIIASVFPTKHMIDNVTATLIFEWKVSDYKVISNCADMVINRNKESASSTKLDMTVYSVPYIVPIPDHACSINPNASFYTQLTTAGIGDECGSDIATCAVGQCCGYGNMCGPFVATVTNSLGAYASTANYGFISAIDAIVAHCGDHYSIDNRYMPTNDISLLDLCWKCTLDDPTSCTYDHYLSNVTAVGNIYRWESNRGVNETYTYVSVDGSHSSQVSMGGMIGMMVFAIVCGLVCICLARILRTHKINTGIRMERLLTSESDLSQPKRKKSGSRHKKRSSLDHGPQIAVGADDISLSQPPPQQQRQSVMGSKTSESESAAAAAAAVGDEDAKEASPAAQEKESAGVGSSFMEHGSLDSGNESESDLPPGWRIYYTENGDPYFHNPTLNITQWETPEK